VKVTCPSCKAFAFDEVDDVGIHMALCKVCLSSYVYVIDLHAESLLILRNTREEDE
jgi:hypothetical protein